MTVTHRLGSDTVQLATSSGVVVAAHRRAVDGSGAVVRDVGQVVALEQAVLSAFSTAKPCIHKTRRPPPAAAVAEAVRLRGVSANDPAQKVLIGLAVYAARAAQLSAVPQHPPPEQEE